MLIGLALCVMVCLAAGQPVLDKSLAKMGQASEDVMAILQELQDKMLAEEGMVNFYNIKNYYLRFPYLPCHINSNCAKAVSNTLRIQHNLTLLSSEQQR